LLCDIWEKAYPILSETRLHAPTDREGDLTASGKKMVRKAVQTEKQRLMGKKKRRVADTELGRTVQDQMGAPAALINRFVKQAATKALKKYPASGPKQ
jgi:hypothetical protein